MDLQQRKQALLQYVLNHMTEYDFNRTDESMGFTSYRKFAQHQANVINGFNETSIGTMEFLRDRIVSIADTMDKETMGNFRASGFCFSANNRIVFFNER